MTGPRAVAPAGAKCFTEHGFEMLSTIAADACTVVVFGLASKSPSHLITRSRNSQNANPGVSTDRRLSSLFSDSSHTPSVSFDLRILFCSVANAMSFLTTLSNILMSASEYSRMVSSLFCILL